MSILNLKDIRTQRNLTELQLSRMSGISRSYVCELENGKYNNPGVKIISKLCKALKVTPNDLIKEELWRWEK